MMLCRSVLREVRHGRVRDLHRESHSGSALAFGVAMKLPAVGHSYGGDTL